MTSLEKVVKEIPYRKFEDFLTIDEFNKLKKKKEFSEEFLIM